MRQFIRFISGTLCFASIVLAGCEEMDGSCNVAWTLGWMLSAVVWGAIFNRMEEKSNG